MFSSKQFFPDALLARLTETRVSDPISPGAPPGAHSPRAPRPSGKLNILAADHPARNVTKVGADPLAMADPPRLSRPHLCACYRASGWTESWRRWTFSRTCWPSMDCCARRARPHCSTAACLIGSSTGVASAGSAWELDDPVTGVTPATCAGWRLDGAKLCLRVDEREPASLQTLLACAAAH